LEIWEGALNTLKSRQSFTGGNDNEKLWSKLRISHDHLDKKHQNMFLDIVYFLGGLKISTIYRAWSGDYLHSYDILGAGMLWKPKEARILTNFIDQLVKIW
jgi:hypothetical protein